MNTDRKTVLKKLFFSTLYLSTFTFGGGYVIVSLMKKKFVDELNWIEEEEMLDLVAIAQSSPGAVAVNGAIVLGCKLAGIAGSAVAVLGAIIPPFVIISLISAAYTAVRDSFVIKELLNGMQAGVGAVIASVVYDMASGIVKKKDILSIVLMLSAFAAACFYKVNVVLIIVFCAVLGLVRGLLEKRRASK